MKRFLLLLPLLLFAVPAQADPLSVTLPECSAARHDAYRIQGPDGESQWWPNGSDLYERKERAQWDDYNPRRNVFIGGVN